MACLDPTVIDGGKDLERLKRRFDAFTGVSLKGEAYIENGLDRLLLPNEFGPDHAIDVLNKEMTTIATDRSQLGSRWISAISNGKVLQRELKVFYKGKLPYNREKKLLRVNMAKYMAIEISLGLGLYLSEFFLKNMSVILQKGVLSVLYLLMGGVMIGFAPKTYKAIKLYVGFGNTQKRTLRIGKAILNVLQKTKAIRTDPHQFQVAMEDYGMGTFACYLKGATTHKSSLFLDILKEVLAPVENPRYLLSSRNWLRLKWTARNYYVVPNYFGKRKSDAELFHQSWEKHVGKTKLLYTRTLEGRKELLKARLSHIKYQFEEVSRKVIAWK